MVIPIFDCYEVFVFPDHLILLEVSFIPLPLLDELQDFLLIGLVAVANCLAHVEAESGDVVDVFT